MPTWRAWLVITAVAFTGTLYAAWRKVPGFQDAVHLVWGDAKKEAGEQVKKARE